MVKNIIKDNNSDNDKFSKIDPLIKEYINILINALKREFIVNVSLLQTQISTLSDRFNNFNTTLNVISGSLNNLQSTLNTIEKNYNSLESGLGKLKTKVEKGLKNNSNRFDNLDTFIKKINEFIETKS